MPARLKDLDLGVWGTRALVALLVYLALDMRGDIKTLAKIVPKLSARIDVEENVTKNHLARLDAQNSRLGRLEELFIRRPTQ